MQQSSRTLILKHTTATSVYTVAVVNRQKWFCQ